VQVTLLIALSAKEPSLTWLWHRLVRLGLPLWLEVEGKINKQGVCHTVALPFTFFKSILMQKKNYGNSNISPCKNIVFQKKKKPKSFKLSYLYN
jgi:hypothetical protein